MHTCIHMNNNPLKRLQLASANAFVAAVQEILNQKLVAKPICRFLTQKLQQKGFFVFVCFKPLRNKEFILLLNFLCNVTKLINVTKLTGACHPFK